MPIDLTQFQTRLGELADIANKEPVTGQGLISELAGGAYEAVRSGSADIFHVLHKITDVAHKLAKDMGSEAERPEIFKKVAESIGPEDFSDEASLARKIGRTIGGILVAVPKYALALKTAGVTSPLGMAAVGGAVDALTAWGHEAPPKEIAKEAARGATFFGGLGVAGKTLSRWPRAGAMAAGSTALEAAMGTTNPEDLAITGVTMGILGLPSRLPHGMREKLHRLKYPDVVIDRMPLKELRRIIREGEEFVPKETPPPAPIGEEFVPKETPPPAPIIEPTTQPQPQPSWGDLGFGRGLLGKEKTERLREIQTSEDVNIKILRQRGIPDEDIARMPQEVRQALASSPESTAIPRGVEPDFVLPYIYERILLSKGFDLRSISALPYAEKAALAKSSYGPKDIIIDPITGQLRYNPKSKNVKEPTKENQAVDQLVVDTSKIQEVTTKLAEQAETGRFGEIVTAEPPKTRSGIPVVPGLTTMYMGEQVVVEKVGSKNARVRSVISNKAKVVPIDKLDTVDTRGKKPIQYNKEVYDVVVNKFDLEPSDAKKVAAYLTERNILKPDEITAFFDSIPGLSEVGSFKDHVVSGVKIKGERLYDIITKPGEREVTAEQQLHSEITRKLSEKTYNKARESILAQIDNIKRIIINTGILADNIKRLENISPELRKKKLSQLKEKVKKQKDKLKELDSQLKQLDKEWKHTQELSQKLEIETKKPKKVKDIKDLLEMIKKSKEEAESLEADKTATKSKKKGTEKTADIEREAKPEGIETVETKPGDKAISINLGISKEEAARLRASLPDNLEGKFKVAVEVLGLKNPELIPADQRQLIVDAYLNLLDSKAEKAKAFEKVDNEAIKAAKEAKDVISTDAKNDPELGRLINKYKLAKEKELEGEALYNYNLIDAAELAELKNRTTEAAQAVEKRRLELNKMKAKVKKSGLDQVGYAVSKEESGAVIIRKTISPTMDHFYMVANSEGKAPLAGESGLKNVGKMIVDKSSGSPVVTEISDISLPHAEFFKNNFIQQVKDYYAKSGQGLQFQESGGVVLRTGIDPTMVSDAIKRLKDFTVNFYRSIRERKGANAVISRDEIPQVQRDVEYAQRARLSKEEISQLNIMNEQMRTAEEGTKASIATQRTAAPEALQQQLVAQVGFIDQFGQNAANKNPDIVRINELGQIRNLRIGHANDRMIYGEAASIKKIFEKINEQPNAEELRNIVGASLISETKGLENRALFSLAKWYNVSEQEAASRYKRLVKHPLVQEAREQIKQFLDGMADTNDLRKRGFFVNEYFPLIADMNNTYLKIKGMFATINEPSKLPERYWIGGEPTLTQAQLNELHAIFQKYKTWDELPNIAKNKIRTEILQFESIYDNYAFIPPDVQEALGVKKGKFNPHLQERKKGELLEYEMDAERVLKFYTYTMNRTEADALFIKEVRPIVNKYASTSGGGSISDVRFYMESQIKAILGRRTPAERYAAALAERLNERTGKEVLSPTWLSQVASRVSVQVARGALGPDTAMRNIFDTARTAVTEGGWTTLRAINTYLSDIAAQITHGKFGKRIDPEITRFYNILLGEVLQDVELPRELQLKPRLARAEGKLGKALSFYDWISDIAMTPLRATEHFNRFINFLAALENAGKRGESFESGVRIGLLHNTRLLPDLVIPTAYWNAAQSVIRTQYGYSKNLKNPLLRGPLARMSTIFWGYGLNTAQFAMNGLHRAIGSGDIAMFSRYAMYTGMQLSIAAAVLALGLDFSSVFGVGILPVKILSLPWDMLKGAYNMAFGKRAEDRSRGSDDFLNAGGILSIPQYRYGSKVVREMRDLMEGYRRAGSLELIARETTPFSVIMSLIGFPLSSNREIYDLVATMSDDYYEYRQERRDLVKKALAAMDKGDFQTLNKIYEKAAKNNIVLTHTDMRKYYKMHKTVTYLQQQLKKIPKHLRPAYEKQIQELEAQYLPSMASPYSTARSMWVNNANNEE